MNNSTVGNPDEISVSNPDEISISNRDEIYDFIVKLNEVILNEESRISFIENYCNNINSIKALKFKDIIIMKYLINFLFNIKDFNRIKYIKAFLYYLLNVQNDFIQYIYALLYLIKILSKIYKLNNKIKLNNEIKLYNKNNSLKKILKINNSSRLNLINSIKKYLKFPLETQEIPISSEEE